MTIENRTLPVGSRLVARYRKQEYVCTVAQTEDGKTVYVLDDGRRFKSPSAAGSAVMNGMACNGWRFWSLESEAKAKESAPTTEPAKLKSKQQGRILRRTPNQKGVAEGQVRYFCAACLKSYEFDAAAGEPEQCPEGHKATAEEFFANDAA
jgi:hypothetical protein